MKALCTGSFDPITIGHFDLISRAAALFEGVVVAVTNNSEKKYMFSLKERLGFAEAALASLPNVKVVACDGWVADLAAKEGCGVIVRSARSGADFDYEAPMAKLNLEKSGVETLILPADPALSWVSSTFVRETIKYGKDYSALVPKGVLPEKEI